MTIKASADTNEQVRGIQSLLAARTRMTAASASAAAGQRARELKANGVDIVNLTVGEPDFDTPRDIRDAAIAAINRGETRYTAVTGTPQLKMAIANKFERDNGVKFGLDEIIVGCGAKHLIFNAFQATIEPGDEVIVPAPYWVSYPEMVRFCGGTPVIVRGAPEAGFKITSTDLEAAITPRTKWLVINSPNNPSGAVYSAQELKSLLEVLERNPHVWVMTDDIYEHIIFDGRRHQMLAALAPSMRNRLLSVNGPSKTYCMTGWRIGYAAAPKELISEIGKIQSQSTSNPCSISQAATIAALDGTLDIVRQNADEYAARRDLMVEALNRSQGITCQSPDGAFYVFPSCEELIGKITPSGQRIKSDTDFVAYLLECGVACIAGSAFGYAGHFRLSIATSLNQLKTASERIHSACAALREAGDAAAL